MVLSYLIATVKFRGFPTAGPLFYFVLLTPSLLFGPALLFGTLE